MMKIYINRLADDIKSHVILNQPDSFAKAENLARLREVVMTNDWWTTARSNILQDQRIKELEGQVDLLVSLTSKSKSASNSQFSNVHAVPPNLSVEQAVVKGSQQPVTRSERELLDFQNNVLAALDAKFSSFNNQNGRPKFSHKDNHHFSCGRNLRTTDSQPICNNCYRVGHVARYCRSQSFQAQSQQFSNQNHNPTQSIMPLVSFMKI